MKISKEEFKNKLSEKVTDNDILIELLEDVEDSFEITEALENKISELESNVVELKEKYKNRFLSKKENKETEETEKPEDEKIIDIKEI